MEGWKGRGCLNHRLRGLHGLRGEEEDKIGDRNPGINGMNAI